jgi:magnesium-protoporphyrin O-methyltransferase
MTCCNPIQTDTGRLFSWFAVPHRLRHRLFGFEKTQRQLLEGIRQAGFQDEELLDIGCGPGYLHQSLLKDGATRSIGVDLSPGMLAEARKAAKTAGLEGCTDYRCGDFVQLADELPAADVTLLDKVVCCYPDWEALLNSSLAKTRRVYALTYPRDRIMTRTGSRILHWGMELIHCCYQPYIHDPQKIQQRILEHGFQQNYEALTNSWYTQVYVRSGSA